MSECLVFFLFWFYFLCHSHDKPFLACKNDSYKPLLHLKPQTISKRFEMTRKDERRKMTTNYHSCAVVQNSFWCQENIFPPRFIFKVWRKVWKSVSIHKDFRKRFKNTSVEPEPQLYIFFLKIIAPLYGWNAISMNRFHHIHDCFFNVRWSDRSVPHSGAYFFELFRH